MIGPGEVADITFASRASVVIAFPWVEGGHGAARDARAWVRVEVDGIVRGAWTSRASRSIPHTRGRSRQQPQRRGRNGARRGRSGAHPRGQRQLRFAAR